MTKSKTVKKLKFNFKSTNRVDMLAYSVGVGGNIASFPQIMKAWSGPAPGLAILTWVLFALFGLVWLAYAIEHKQKPLLVSQLVSLSCNLAVISGWVVHQWVF